MLTIHSLLTTPRRVLVAYTTYASAFILMEMFLVVVSIYRFEIPENKTVIDILPNIFLFFIILPHPFVWLFHTISMWVALKQNENWKFPILIPSILFGYVFLYLGLVFLIYVDPNKSLQ